MSNSITITSPIDGRLVATRQLASDSEITAAIDSAKQAQQAWQSFDLEDRAKICRQAVANLLDNKQQLGEQITLQMGRPIRYSPNEINGLADRAHYMIDIAETALADIEIEESKTHKRLIQHVPLGTVFIIAPWNYPYLTAINSLIPALMAGNCVLLKHSKHTLLCADQLEQAFSAAGLPEGVFQVLHLDHQQAQQLMQHQSIGFVAFTGSVSAGASIEQTLAGCFKGLALELGGKDGAYVMADADVAYSVEQLVDGAFFNSGQSCCGIERIYVHQSLYKEFVEGFIELTKQYQIGDPLDQATTLGPMVSTQAADTVRAQIQDAVSRGAQAAIDESLFATDYAKGAYLPPQVLLNVDHSMSVMQQESFGPVVGIMAVNDDKHALRLLNDCQYGLTNSLWTRDRDRAFTLGQHIDSGTVFMNRCDYLDPALAWVGVKQSGRGCSLSQLGYQQLTRPKSFYLQSC